MTKIVVRLVDVDPSYAREEAIELQSHLEDVGWKEFSPRKSFLDENQEYTIRELYLKRD